MQHNFYSRALLPSALMLCGAGSLLATPVRLTVPTQAPVLKVTKAGESAGLTLTPDGAAFTAQLDPGDYTASIYQAGVAEEGSETAPEDIFRGSISFTVADQADEQTVGICMVRASVQNRTNGADYYQPGVDYTLAELLVMEQMGAKHEVAYSGSEENGIYYYYFPVLQGNTYSITVNPTDIHANIGPATGSATVTAAYSECRISMPSTGEFLLTAPKEATVFVGTKVRHYVPFTEVAYTSREESGDNYIYHYNISNGAYNYRVKLPGYMTHAGKFGVNEKLNELTFTEEYLKSHGEEDYLNRDKTFNENGNMADILLTVNERNHLNLRPGDEYIVTPQRTWQLIDDQSNNYYIEPDYHFTVLDENFKPSDEVIGIVGNGYITAKKEGTAIVLVNYDACYAYSFNNPNGFAWLGQNHAFWFGALWSRLWPENTGVFVVTVGDSDKFPDSDTFRPNFMMEGSNPQCRDRIVDCELDAFYYLESEKGYYYTFAPEGASAVEVARPDVDLEANTIEYGRFSTDDVTLNDDGTYTVLLKHGRNVLRVKSSEGAYAYQVLTARPMGYEITNKTHDDGTIYAGDELEVQFHGFYHPTPKLAGIYNQSANVYFSIANNEGGLILGPGQYVFAGNPAAQLIKLSVPADYDNPTLDFAEGAIWVKGYGSIGGMHRKIDPRVGTNPNFTAPVTSQYWSSVPEIRIPVAESTGGITFSNIPAAEDGYIFDLTSPDGKKSYYIEGKTEYKLGNGKYIYSVTKGKITLVKETVEIADEVIAIDVTLPTGGVRFEDLPEAYTLKLTDADGKDLTEKDQYEYQLPAGTFRYELYLGGLKAVDQEFEVADEIVTIHISLPQVGVKFDVDDAATILFCNENQTTDYTVSGVREYICVPGTYSYIIQNPGHLQVEGTVEVNDQFETVKADYTLTPSGTWDGESFGVPYKVTAAESAEGDLAGMEGFYKISNGAELAWFAQKSRKFIPQNDHVSAVLTSDIDLGGKDWVPIGNEYSEQFRGTFDGMGHKISNIYVSEQIREGGLFGTATGSENDYSFIRNFSLDGNIKAANGGAAIVNNLRGTILNDITNYANVSGGRYAAGIVNYCGGNFMNDAQWSDLRNYGDMTGEYVGGVCYEGRYPNMSRIENHGTLTTTSEWSRAGALIFNLHTQVTVTDSYNTGEIVPLDNENSSIKTIGCQSADMRNVFDISDNASTHVFTGYNSSQSTYENIFVLDNDKAGGKGSDTDGNRLEYEYVSSAQVADGELAWRLGEPFGQKIGEDAHPVIDGEKVYRIFYTLVDEESADPERHTLYTNAVLPANVGDSALYWYTDEACTTPFEGEVNADDLELFASRLSTGVNGIHADSDAEWYTLDGLRIEPADAQQPGVYIVRRAGETRKVIVR